MRADLLLPAAGWGEKEGTFINSERRLGLSKKVARAPGQALADFHIFQLVAEAWGVGDLFRRWSSPEAVFEILKQVSRGQPCDISGVVDYTMIDRLGGVQWPLPEGTTLESNERRLFSDGRFFFADGRARLIVDQPRPVPETPSKAFPLVLLTGRGSSSQWHTQTRTGKSAVLRKLAPAELYVEVNPADAAPLKLTSQRMGGGDLAARGGPGAGVHHPHGPRRRGVHAHALPRHEPADLPGVRSPLAPAVVQVLRRPDRADRPGPQGLARPGAQSRSPATCRPKKLPSPPVSPLVSENSRTQNRRPPSVNTKDTLAV